MHAVVDDVVVSLIVVRRCPPLLMALGKLCTKPHRLVLVHVLQIGFDLPSRLRLLLITDHKST